MKVTPQNVRSLAQAKENQNWSFRSYLKGQDLLSSEELDQLVFKITKRVWQTIDCTTCANCCREINPTFTKEDLQKTASHLKLSPQDFIAKYLKPKEPSDTEPQWVTRDLPCPFLKDNLCQVYDARPMSCQKYPYLYEPDFNARTIGMINRTFTCPIVYRTLEELQNEMKSIRGSNPDDL